MAHLGRDINEVGCESAKVPMGMTADICSTERLSWKTILRGLISEKETQLRNLRVLEESIPDRLDPKAESALEEIIRSYRKVNNLYRE